MTIKELANQLRQRQYKAKIVTRKQIDSLSDIEIINSYVTCSCCGEKQCTETQLLKAINDANDVNHFFDITDMLATLNTHRSQN